MYLSAEQMAAVRHGHGSEPTYEWVDVPVGPQPLPAWAKGLKISWMDGYANAPHYTVKTDRALQHWPDQVFTKEGERYLALSGDGRARCYYAHGEPFITEMRQKMICYPVSPPDQPDAGFHDKTGRWWCSEMKPSGRIWWSTYKGWATIQDRGFGGDNIPIKLDDGRWLMLRGPWHGAAPAGYLDVGGAGRTPGASGTGLISQEVLILLIAKHYPECRVARVTQYGCTEVQAVRPDWDEPKRWMDERARAAKGRGMTAPVMPAAEARDRLAKLVADALEAFQQRDGYHKAVIVDLLEDFGTFLATPLATALAESTARTDDAVRERDEARADRATLTKALTGLTCGGSEFFVRRGEDFIADAPVCVEHVRSRIQRAYERSVAAVQQANVATARIAALEAALEPLRKFTGTRFPDDSLCTIQVYAQELRAIAAALQPNPGGSDA